jgi:hypothetical protein
MQTFICADQDQSALLVCSVCFSVSREYFENFLKNVNGFVQIESWTSPFQIFSMVRVMGNRTYITIDG